MWPAGSGWLGWLAGTTPLSRLWNPWKEGVDGPGPVHSFLLLSVVTAGAPAAPPLLPAAEFLHDEEDPEVHTVVAPRNGQVSTGAGSASWPSPEDGPAPSWVRLGQLERNLYSPDVIVNQAYC